MYCHYCKAEVAGRAGGECFYCGNLFLSDEEEEGDADPRWIVGKPGGPQGPFHSIVSNAGRVIAMQVPDKKVADEIASLVNVWDADLEYSPGCDCDYCEKLRKAFSVLITA